MKSTKKNKHQRSISHESKSGTFNLHRKRRHRASIARHKSTRPKTHERKTRVPKDHEMSQKEVTFKVICYALAGEKD